MPRRTRKSLKAACDRLWSKKVKSLADYQCERCSASPEAQRGFHAHHVYGRINHRLRFEPRNGTALCGSCHRWAEECSLEFTDWFREHRAKDAEWLAVENRKGLVKRSLDDYLELERALQNQREVRADGTPS